MIDPAEFRRLVRHGLAEADLRDVDLAEALGWSTGRLSNYMTGTRRPGLEDVLLLARFLAIDPGPLAASQGYDPSLIGS